MPSRQRTLSITSADEDDLSGRGGGGRGSRRSSERRLSECLHPHLRPRRASWRVRAKLWLYEKAVIFQMIALVSMEPLITKLGAVQREEDLVAAEGEGMAAAAHR